MAPTLLVSRVRLGESTREEDGGFDFGSAKSAPRCRWGSTNKDAHNRPDSTGTCSQLDMMLSILTQSLCLVQDEHPAGRAGVTHPEFLAVVPPSFVWSWNGWSSAGSHPAALRGLTTTNNGTIQQRTAMEIGGGVRVKVADPSLSVPPALDDHPTGFTTTGLLNHDKLRRIVAYIQHRKHTRPHPCPQRLIACGATRTTPTAIQYSFTRPG